MSIISDIQAGFQHVVNLAKLLGTVTARVDTLESKVEAFMARIDGEAPSVLAQPISDLKTAIEAATPPAKPPTPPA